MYDERSQPANAPTPRSPSRIETQTETIKNLTARIERLTETNIQHARQLGYFEPPKDATAGVSPVQTTMDDAIRSLERAVDHLDGSMNLFN